MKALNALAVVLVAQSSPPQIAPELAAGHVGQIVEVCGVVETSNCSKGERVLDFSSESRFRLVVPPSAGRTSDSKSG